MTTPQKNEQAGAFIPILMILVGVALISVGWIVNDPTGEIQNSIGDVIEEIFNPTKTITVENPEQTPEVSNPATATTLVIVLPNDNQPAPPAAPAAPAPVMPVAAPAAHAPVMPVAAPAPAPVMPVAPPAAPAPPAAVGGAPTAPVVIVTATEAPVIMVTATLNNELVKEINTQATAAAAITPAVITTATLTGEQGAINQNVSGHCSEWTDGECEIHPTATQAPTYVPPSATPTTAPSQTALPTWTPLPPTPTITPTPLPENNSVTSIVTLQGANSHGGTSIIVTNSAGVVAHATTSDVGMWTLSGLDKGSYQLAAYSANGSHLPACKEITVGGNESIAIPQTMLSNGGGFNTDETVNIGAAALVTIEFGLTIPEHMLPILDVNNDSLVDKTDADMLIANPKLLACQAW